MDYWGSPPPPGPPPATPDPVRRPAPAPGQSRLSGPLGAVLAFGIVATGVVGVWFYEQWNTDRPAAEATSERPAAIEIDPNLVPDTAGAQSLIDAGWDPTLAPYVRFVEQARQLEFNEPVEVVRGDVGQLIAADDEPEVADDDAETNDVTTGDVDPDGIGYDPYEVAYVSLGLIGTGPGELDGRDPAATTNSMDEVRETNAAAFYDRSEQTIVLPVDDGDPTVELSIVHELTHALQDQNAMLHFPERESVGAYRLRLAILEGDATRVENLYYSLLPLSSQVKIDVAYEQQGDAAEQEHGEVVADFYTADFYASYWLGEPLVEIIVQNQGLAGINQMLRSKNLASDEQLLDPLAEAPWPQSYVATELVDGLGNEWYDGWVGAFGWYYALATRYGPADAYEAILGYEDDAFVTWEADDGDYCVRFAVAFDTQADQRRFVTLIDDDFGDVSFTNDYTTITQCGPPAAPTPEVDGVDLLGPLVAAHWLTVAHIEDSVDDSAARCAAIAQAKDTADFRAEAIEAGVDPANLEPDWDILLADSAVYLQACR